jgi:hypothetical protein
VRKDHLTVPARLLPIYLDDHFAGATFGMELAQRAARYNSDSELGAFLADGLVPEIVEDRRTLRELMERLGLRPSRVKVAAGWLTEKLGRLKLNGELTRYSPLSRLLELEGLATGVEAKRALWLALHEIRGRDPRLADVDFQHLAERAQSQRARLEPFRLAAAAEALG